MVAHYRAARAGGGEKVAKNRTENTRRIYQLAVYCTTANLGGLFLFASKLLISIHL